MSADEPLHPTAVKFHEDEEKKDFVRAAFKIPDLKKPGGFTVKHNAQPSNGSIDLKCTERSFHLKVTVDGKKKYEYKVDKIVQDINKDKTYWKMKDDEQIIIMLHKARTESWAPYLGRTAGSSISADD